VLRKKAAAKSSLLLTDLIVFFALFGHFCHSVYQSMKSFLRFYLLACLLSWIIWLPLYLPAFGVSIPFLLPYHHAFGGLGPLLAAVLITAKEGGRKDLAVLLKRTIAYRPVGLLLVAVFSPFVLLLLAGGIQYLQEGAFLDLHSIGTTNELPQFSVTAFFLFNLLFFGLGEEVGWAGYATPVLQKRFSERATAVLFTAFWAFWHLPLFFYRPGYTAMGALDIAGWFFSLLTGRVLLLWLQQSSRGSILIPALFHATIDVAFTSKATTPALAGYLGMLITFWGLAAFFLLKKEQPSLWRRLLHRKKMHHVV
jgi:membrane protease YdiL (CAAX protease family)